MQLVLDAIEGLEPDQAVVVAVDRSVSLRSVFLLLGVPLVGFIGGAVLGHARPLPGMTPDGSAALLAIALLGVAFTGAILYERRAAAKTVPQPTILRIETK